MAESTNPYPWHHWPQQSPINLTKDDSLYVKFPKSFLKFDYRDAPFSGAFEGEVGHKNFVLEKPHPGKNPPMLKLGNAKAELIKIHLHTPSEHDVEGNDLGGEIHLIHKIENLHAGSELLVVGVFFSEDKSAEQLEFFSMWADQVGGKQNKKSGSVEIDPRKFIPKKQQWYRYEGSLTSEPYSEIVRWLVLMDPIGVVSADFRKLKKNAHQPRAPGAGCQQAVCDSKFPIDSYRVWTESVAFAETLRCR